MKIFLTLIFAVIFSQANAQSYMSSGAPGGATGGGSSSGAIMKSPHGNQRTLEVPYRGATTDKMTSDTIGTTQSSTTTTIKKTKERRVIPITPAHSSGANCVDRTGRSFAPGDSGYTACTNSMMAK